MKVIEAYTEGPASVICFRGHNSNTRQSMDLSENFSIGAPCQAEQYYLLPDFG